MVEYPETGKCRYCMVLTHGAGSNAESPLLRTASRVLTDSGIAVLRYNLPFRQLRASGPPHPSAGARDREGLAETAALLREWTGAPVILAGHSYGGRQASMLAAEQPHCCRALLLLSYPLHPPAKPAQLRTAHFPAIQTPVLFVHGTNDAFGTPEELQSAAAAIPAAVLFSRVEGAGHDLARGRFDWQQLVTLPLESLVR